MLIAPRHSPALSWNVLLLAFVPPGTTAPSLREASDAMERLARFEAFFRQYERQITGYLCRMTGDEQAGLDLSQETFVRAWTHFQHLQVPAAAKAWLFRVATNLALRFLEQRARRPQTQLDDALPGASDPGKRIELLDSVQRVLAKLPAKQRAVLLLHAVQGMGCDEIGQYLGLSRDAVKMSLWRGRERFRSEYLREEAEG